MMAVPLVKALSPPNRFDDPILEAAFRRRFLVAGLRLSRLAALIGAAVAAGFWSLLELVVLDFGQSSSRQAIRLGIAVVLALVAAFLYARPRTAIRRYQWAVGMPALVVCTSIGALGLLPADVEHQTTTRLATAMIVACWLTYGFARLPPRFAAFVCVLASGITILGATIHKDEYLWALMIYMGIANIVGWTMSVSTERRERDLFLSSRKLLQLAKKLDASAKLSAEANAAKSYMLATVNHDLRQPLTSMALYLGLIDTASKEWGGVNDARNIDQIRECVTAMIGNLSKLSDITLQQGGQIIETRKIDLRILLNRLNSVFSAQALHEGTRIVTRLPQAGALCANSDEARLWDILSNLVSNALKYRNIERPSWVLIRATKLRNKVRITIRDNGVGIDPAYHRRIFDEYFQIGNPQRDRQRGYGLGLSIVRETISRLPGHELSLWSKPGVGTRFDILLPLAEGATGGASENGPGSECRGEMVENAATPRPDDLQPRCPEVLRGCYALVVEDDPPTRRALTDAMEGWGMLVEAVGSPSEALLAVRHSERLFDVVVSDFNLPGATDGVGVIDAVRAEQGQRTPAILVSGSLSSIDRMRLDRLEARTMSKPLDPAHLRAELMSCVEF